MAAAQIEYLGFAVVDSVRAYSLRVRVSPGDVLDVTLNIPNEAFVAHRVRYQDAAEICFIKLQRALLDGPEALRAGRLDVTEADLEDYKAAHAPKPPRRRRVPPVAPVTPAT